MVIGQFDEVSGTRALAIGGKSGRSVAAQADPLLVTVWTSRFLLGFSGGRPAPDYLFLLFFYPQAPNILDSYITCKPFKCSALRRPTARTRLKDLTSRGGGRDREHPQPQCHQISLRARIRQSSSDDVYPRPPPRQPKSIYRSRHSYARSHLSTYIVDQRVHWQWFSDIDLAHVAR